MVGLDNLHVIIGIQGLGAAPDQLHEHVHADAHVAGIDQWNGLSRFFKRAKLWRAEPRGADHERNPLGDAGLEGPGERRWQRDGRMGGLHPSHGVIGQRYADAVDINQPACVVAQIRVTRFGHRANKL